MLLSAAWHSATCAARQAYYCLRRVRVINAPWGPSWARTLRHQELACQWNLGQESSMKRVVCCFGGPAFKLSAHSLWTQTIWQFLCTNVMDYQRPYSGGDLLSTWKGGARTCWVGSYDGFCQDIFPWSGAWASLCVDGIMWDLFRTLPVEIDHCWAMFLICCIEAHSKPQCSWVELSCAWGRCDLTAITEWIYREGTHNANASLQSQCITVSFLFWGNQWLGRSHDSKEACIMPSTSGWKHHDFPTEVVNCWGWAHCLCLPYTHYGNVWQSHEDCADPTPVCEALVFVLWLFGC